MSTTTTTSHTACDERAACDCLCHHHCPKRRYPEHVCGASCRPCDCRHRRQAAGPPSSNSGLGRLGGSAPCVILCGSSKASGQGFTALSCQRENDARISLSTTSHHGNHDTHISGIFQFNLPLSCCCPSSMQRGRLPSFSSCHAHLASCCLLRLLIVELPQSGTEPISGPKAATMRKSCGRPLILLSLVTGPGYRRYHSMLL